MRTCLPFSICLAILQDCFCLARKRGFIMPGTEGALPASLNEGTPGISCLPNCNRLRDENKHVEIAVKNLESIVQTGRNNEIQEAMNEMANPQLVGDLPSETVLAEKLVKLAGAHQEHLIRLEGQAISGYASPSHRVQSARDALQYHDTPSLAGLKKLGQHSNIATIESHKDQVFALAVCGDLLYTASESKKIRVSRAPMFDELDCFGCGSGAVQSLMAFQDHLYSAHQDNKIRVWKRVMSSDGRCRHKLVAVLPRLEDCVRSMLLQSNYVQVRRHKRKLWIEHNDRISALALGGGRSPNEGGQWQPSILYSASWDKTVKVWSLSNFKCVESFHAHHDAINAMVVIDGSVLATASSDCTIKLWTKMSYTTRRKKHALISTMEGQKAAVNALAMSADSKVMYTGGADGTVMAWKKVYSGGGRKGRISRGSSLGKQSSANRGGLLSGEVSIGYSGGSGEILSRASSLASHGLLNIKKVISYHNRLRGAGSAIPGINFIMKKALVGHTRSVLSVSSAGDDVVCSSSADTTIRVWMRARETRRRWEYVCFGVLSGHGAPVKAIASVQRPTSHFSSSHDQDAAVGVGSDGDVDAAGVIVYSGGLDSKVKVWALNISG